AGRCAGSPPARPLLDLLAREQHEHVLEVRRPALALERMAVLVDAENRDARPRAACAQTRLCGLGLHLGEPRGRAVDLEHFPARAAFDSFGSRKPSSSISPSSAIACAVRRRMVVDLPAPFGPSSPTQVPTGTSRSSPFTAVIWP